MRASCGFLALGDLRLFARLSDVRVPDVALSGAFEVPEGVLLRDPLGL